MKKRFAAVLLALLLAGSAAWAVEYFGNTTPSANFYGDTSGYWNAAQAFTCPGSGNYNLISLGLYAKKGTETGNIRIAIYDAAGSFIAQGSAEVAVDNTTAQWWEHTAFILRAGEICYNEPA